MFQIEQSGEKQSDKTKNHAFKMIAQTGLFDERLCSLIDDDENTDEDEISDDRLDYEVDGDDVMVDEVLEFDEDDVG